MPRGVRCPACVLAGPLIPRRLTGAGAFHTRYREPAREHFGARAAGVPVRDPELRLLSNADGTAVQRAGDDAQRQVALAQRGRQQQVGVGVPARHGQEHVAGRAPGRICCRSAARAAGARASTASATRAAMRDIRRWRALLPSILGKMPIAVR